jgi:Holliday junction DNA helicase RuvA
VIGHLTGSLLRCSPGRVLLDVAGVGYELQIPIGTFYALSAAPSGRASLHVHTHLRQDSLQLFGFATEAERASFERLIGISGVGPRLALAILSGIGVDELHRAVREEDRARLCKIPGVGRKTAERVLLELRDKLDRPVRGKTGHAPASPPSPEGEGEDAVSALVNLGYSPEVARRAVAGALEGAGPEAALETVLRAALGGLSR